MGDGPPADTPPMADVRRTAGHPSVYPPSDDSFALVDALAAEGAWLAGRRPQVCLEVGCGSGYVVCTLALLLESWGLRPAVFGTDRNPEAVRCARETLGNHGVGHRVELVVSDLFRNVGPALAGAVDLLVFNPPYVPTPPEEVAGGGIYAAWAGGERGREVIDAFLAEAPRVLSASGCVYMIAIAQNDPEEILAVMRGRGFAGANVLTRKADEEVISVLKFWRGAGDA